MSKIIVHDLTKIYNAGQQNEVIALKGASFEIDPGEFVVILGPSGAGKSTLLNILGGMDTATSGSYMVDGKDVAKYKSSQLGKFRRQSVGFVFQFYNLMPNLTALENVELASSVADDPLVPDDVLTSVGLKDREGNFPAQLSGGEQQRVAIARAVVKNPELLLCDEPTGALDSKTGGSIIALLSRTAKKLKKSVIIVTHNSKIADCAERVIRIQDGAIVSNQINPNPIAPEAVNW